MQQPIETGSSTSALRELFHQRLKEGPVPINKIGDWEMIIEALGAAEWRKVPQGCNRDLSIDVILGREDGGTRTEFCCRTHGFVEVTTGRVGVWGKKVGYTMVGALLIHVDPEKREVVLANEVGQLTIYGDGGSTFRPHPQQPQPLACPNDPGSKL